jgi:hypothetical protein
MRALAARAVPALVAIAACVPVTAGCARPTPTPAPAPVANTSAPPPPNASAPPPHIDWRDGRFDTANLPALGTRGEVVVVPMIENDGGRGFPNLRIEVHDASDRVIRRIDVMTANEYETLVPDGEHASPTLTARIETANRALETLATEHDLAPMQQRKNADLTIDFAAHGWLAPKGPRCAGCPPCENPPYLDAVYESAHSRLLLVRVAYRGTDTCWEPSPQWHVIVPVTP